MPEPRHRVRRRVRDMGRRSPMPRRDLPRLREDVRLCRQAPTTGQVAQTVYHQAWLLQEFGKPERTGA